MKKVTYRIPFDYKGNAPSYARGTEEALQIHRQKLQSQLDAPFDPKVLDDWMKTEEQWKESLQRQIEYYTFNWKDPEEFVDTFEIVSYSRGRSAANFDLKSTIIGMECHMFMSNMIDLIHATTIKKGIVSGRWIFVKKGTNYGIKYLGETNET